LSKVLLKYCTVPGSRWTRTFLWSSWEKYWYLKCLLIILLRTDCTHYYDLPLKKDDGKIISLDILYKVDLIMMDNEFDGCHGVTLEGEQKKMTNGLLSSLSCVSYLSDKTVGMFKYFSVQIISDYYHSIILCIPSMLNWEYGIESWQLTVPGWYSSSHSTCVPSLDGNIL